MYYLHVFGGQRRGEEKKRTNTQINKTEIKSIFSRFVSHYLLLSSKPFWPQENPRGTRHAWEGTGTVLSFEEKLPITFVNVQRIMTYKGTET